ncbi:hypothetical protein, partial [Streptomyces sp. NPDC101455]|uniref:hypothetical protein n=1 Tax=Streptomyces sp. NPDC101455 TaxID=3366142 RepID=UPI0038242490
PDEQVQTVIRLVFAQFERLGTLHGVLRHLVDNDIQLGIRLREGPDKGTLLFRAAPMTPAGGACRQQAVRW